MIFFGVESLSLCWDCRWTAATDASSSRGKSLHSCCRRTGGLEPADPFVLLVGWRERPFAVCRGQLQMVLLVTGSLYLFVCIFLSICLRLYVEIFKLAFSVGGY